MLVKEIHASFNLPHTVFGIGNAGLCGNKITHHAKNTVIIYTASALRCRELLNVDKACLSKKIAQCKKHSFCGKMIFKSAEMDITYSSCALDETKKTVDMLILSGQCIIVCKPECNLPHDY